jgi:hypothetical protein
MRKIEGGAGSRNAITGAAQCGRPVWVAMRGARTSLQQRLGDTWDSIKNKRLNLL